MQRVKPWSVQHRVKFRVVAARMLRTCVIQKSKVNLDEVSNHQGQYLWRNCSDDGSIRANGHSRVAYVPFPLINSPRSMMQDVVPNSVDDIQLLQDGRQVFPCRTIHNSAFVQPRQSIPRFVNTHSREQRDGSLSGHFGIMPEDVMRGDLNARKRIYEATQCTMILGGSLVCFGLLLGRPCVKKELCHD